MRPEEVIRVGTRKSPLAQAQTDRVLARLQPGRARKLLVESEGDLDATRAIHEMERPGAFTSALTDAILDGRIDAAVHSLKDLPLDAPAEAPIVAVLPRDDAADVLVQRRDATDPARPLGLKAGARVGTSAPRRQTQALAADPELVPVDVRGNVGTRLNLLRAGVIDALLMARAAFERIDLPLPDGCDARRLDPRLFPTAPGQGAIAVQARAGSAAEDLLRTLDNPPTREAVAIEREVLRRLGGGCGLPLGAHAARDAQGWRLDATLAGEGWEDAIDITLGRAQVVGARQEELIARALLALQTAPAPPPAPPAPRVVLMTLGPDSVPTYAKPLLAAGWTAWAWPLLDSELTSAAAPERAAEAAWVAVASPRAAPYAAAHVRATGGAPRVAALGPATARALRRERLAVHVVSPGATGASLAEAVAAFPAPPGTVLLPQAEDALPDLADGLRKHGFLPLAWACYRTTPRRPPPEAPSRADAIVLTSPSNVRAYLAHPSPPRAPLIAFGRTTEAAMREAGLTPRATMRHPTPSALLEVLP